MFQDYLLFPHLTAVDNVAFDLRLHPTPAREPRRSSDSSGSASPSTPGPTCRPRVDNAARRLSLPSNPVLLPMSRWPRWMRGHERACDDLSRTCASLPAVVLVSHDPVDAAVLADEIAILDRGGLIQRGTVRDVLAQPRSRYVADLVGVNLLEGHGDGHEVTVTGLPMPRGYAHGRTGRGTALHVAGQIGCDEHGALVTTGLASWRHPVAR
jgi:molybdate transport system ATP-binding protein